MSSNSNSSNNNNSKERDRGASVKNAAQQPTLPRAKSWANPSSKFNKILNNLEKSILGQFSTNTNANAQSSANRLKFVHQNQNTTQSAPINTRQLKTQNDQQHQNATTSEKRIALHQQQKQLKSEPATAKVKTTLNKYQQQIVSTMRQNSNHLLLNNVNYSPLSNASNNKLSIPPPHANDEARNQSHRMLFGASASTNDQQQQQSDPNNKEGLAVGSSVTLRPSKRNTTTRVGGIIRLDDALASSKIDAVTRVSSSPASSAKSLPTTITTSNKSSSRSQAQNSNTDSEAKANNSQEDEESGFSTYQSNRSLIANSYNKATGDKLSNQQDKNSNNNMIIMQTQTQVSPLISGQFMNFNGNPPLGQQKMMYGYNQQQFPQQSMNTHQHQFGASNQVPIMSTLDQVVANNNCYTNSNQSGASHHQPMRLSQSSHFNDLQHHQNQLHPFVTMYQGSMTAPMPQQQQSMSATNSDLSASGGQEIYANAPPKPRRYQYYDTTAPFGQPRFSHHQLMLAPPQMLVTKPPATMITTTTTALPAINNTNAFYHQQYNARQNYQNQKLMQNQQPAYNISYHRLPNMYQLRQQQQLPSLTSNERPIPIISSSQYNGLQQRPVPPLPTGQAHWMTKSKSSLDAHDLMRYKLNKNLPTEAQLVQPLQARYAGQPHDQQQIYDTRLNISNNLPPYPSINQQQQQMPSAQTNLQRSKSVSQLAPDHEHYDPQRVVNRQATQMSQQRDLLFNDARQTMNGQIRFLSSASTTNLNYVGQNNEQNQFINYPSQSSNLHPQFQYHDLVNQPCNQAATLQRQQHHRQKMSNCWPSHYNQASPSGFTTYNQQQLQHQKSNINSSAGAANTTNLSPIISGHGKNIWQPQNDKSTNNANCNQNDPQKPSLDDKIRFLMTSSGDVASSGGGSTIRDEANSFNGRQESDTTPIAASSHNAIYNQQIDSNSLNQTWNTVTRKQAFPKTTSTTITDLICPDANSSSRSKDLHNENTAISAYSSTRKKDNQSGESSDGLLYVNDYDPTKSMGNRNQRQYQVQNEPLKKVEPAQARGQQQQASAVSQNGPISNDSQRYKSSGNANSQLIVDLTTPRVLAKTQTTLLSTGSQLDLRQNKESSTINQVGLPQLYSGQQEQSTQVTDTRSKEVKLSEQTPATYLPDASLPNKNDICERTAPYYYSDLKSEEQRQALLSIVQQKSLSPPPQLLSRGLDQSGTRLALKSATLHPGQARMLSDNLVQRQRQQASGSTANVTLTKNLFANSPTNRDNKTNVAQSMLALNSCDPDRQFPSCNVQSAISTRSVGGDGGYFDSELKSSKSKSLENLSQRTSREGLDVTSIGSVRQTINKFGVPVYENICRTDKLMSAINNSTTCLSSAKSRANRRPQVDGGISNPATPPSNHQQLQGKCTSVSDESMDSILGSSLDESDSSLDIIDEIKLSPTDNHLSDICKLIEQLKLNHSKLSEEYKSTLVRISKTINSSDKQMVDGDEEKNEKLTRRLHLLEMKSKKCEARSKNQLALIQMMENVLKQSKLRPISTSKKLSNKQTTAESFDENGKLSENDPLCDSFFSYQAASPPQVDAELLSRTNKPFDPSPANQERAELIRAFVTESELHPDVKQLPTKANDIGDSNKQISLSTRHHRQSGSMQQQSKSSAIDTSDKLLDKSRVQQRRLEVEASIVNNNNTSTMKGGSAFGATANGKSSGASSSKESDAEDEAESSSSSDSGSSVSLVSDTIRRSQQKVAVGGSSGKSRRVAAASSMANGLRHNLNYPNDDSLMMKDDEDFIEFLSADTSSHRSQFEASQFSASDFNTSASNTSESSSSGANNDSLNSPLSSNPQDLMASLSANKRSRSSIFNGSDRSDNGCRNYNNNNDTNKSKGERTTPTKSASGFCNSNDGEKFKNVLGNVIDVSDPLNNLAHSSPVNNQA